ncbi:MAG: NADH-quinone oxidoreductase subunit G, partial [Microlunatus sp.]|nr:NADH-quinone oxidoreductase subunit G [Microlunatus sp.]
VALLEERSGTFINWEGRERSFPVVIKKPNAMSDLRVLAALADGLGTSLGIRTTEQAAAELRELADWEGARATIPEPVERLRLSASTGEAPNEAVLSTWRLHLDDARVLDGETELLATARKPVARLSAPTATAAGVADRVTVSTDSGSLTFDVEIVPDLTDGVIWLPTRAPGLVISEHLAVTSGEVVRIEGAHQ